MQPVEKFSRPRSSLADQVVAAYFLGLLMNASTRFWMLTTLALGLLLGGLVAPWVAEYQQQQKTDPAILAAEIEWDAPRPIPPGVPFAASLRVEGYVELMARTIPLPVQTQGTVKEIYVQPGQHVEEGDLVMLIERGFEERQTASLRHRAAQALLAKTEAQLKSARIKESEFAERYERVRKLVAMEAASPQELNQFSYELRLTRARIEELKAERQLHRAQLAEAATKLTRLELRSPMRGQIWSVPAQPGMYIQPGLDYPSVYVAPDPRKVIRVLVPEEEAARLRPRQGAVAYVPGEGGAMFDLAYERTEPEVELQVRLGEEPARFIQVLFRVIGDDESLVLGQKLEVYLEIEAISARTSAQPFSG